MLDTQTETEKPETFVIDTDSGFTIFHSPFLPIPIESEGEFKIDIWSDGYRTHYLYHIDRVDTDLNTVWVTLDKVLINDKSQFPIP